MNLKDIITKNNLILDVEILRDMDSYSLWIGAENGSGASYNVETTEDVADKIKFYIEIYGKGMSEV